MIKDIQNKKVYVYCLASVVTGGCELLHQLVDFLNDNHRDAYIIYIGKGAKKVPEAYSAYITRIKEIFDNFDDALSDQLNYRNHIKEEKKEFENQIRTLFEIK